MTQEDHCLDWVFGAPIDTTHHVHCDDEHSYYLFEEVKTVPIANRSEMSLMESQKSPELTTGLNGLCWIMFRLVMIT